MLCCFFVSADGERLGKGEEIEGREEDDGGTPGNAEGNENILS